MNLTDNEIIKAIEYCSADKIVHCEDCPFYEKCLNDESLFKYALDLINHQQADIENYKQIAEHQQSVSMDKDVEIKRLKAEVEGLKDELEIKSQKRANIFEIANAFERGRTKGIKEFAERLKKAKKYSVERHENIVPVAVIDWILRDMGVEGK